jgi:hypothetical protein
MECIKRRAIIRVVILCSFFALAVKKDSAAQLVHGLEINSQIVDIGPRILVYQYQKNSSPSGAFTQTVLTNDHQLFNPKLYNPGCGLIIDGPLSTLRATDSTVTFFASGMAGLDIYLNQKISSPFGVPQCTQPPSNVYCGLPDRKGASLMWKKRFAANPKDPADTMKSDSVVSWNNPRSRTVDTLRHWRNVHGSFPSWNGYDQDDAWLVNIYRVSQADANSVNQHHPGSAVQSGDIIGFVHIETDVDDSIYNSTFDSNAVYSIGLAYLAYSDYSKNGFRDSQWVYCGDIIRTACNKSINTNNIEGIPYLIVNSNGIQYLYTYFNEFSDPLWYSAGNFTHGKRQSVARDTLYDVLYKARKVHDAGRPSTSNPVPVFYKYAAANKNGVIGWTNHDATGKGGVIDTGAQIIPKCPAVPVPFPRSGICPCGGCIPNKGGPDSLLYDFTSHAAFCKPLGLYMILISNGPDTHSPFGALMMYFSPDGIKWNNPVLVDTTTGTCSSFIEVPHSCFVASPTDKDSSEFDSHVVGSDFDIFFAHTPQPLGPINAGWQGLYRRHVRITQDLFPNNMELLDTK